MTYHLVNFVYLFTLMVFNVTDLKKKKKTCFFIVSIRLHAQSDSSIAAGNTENFA